MIPDLVKTQILRGEGSSTEFQLDAADARNIGKTVCAFLNSNGGTILCGVGRKGEIVGVSEPDALVLKLQGELQDLISPKALFTVNSDVVDGKAIITVEVPEGKDRPYLMAGSVFIRQGAATFPADAYTLRRMIQVKSVSADRWERRPSMAMEDDDLDHDEVQLTAREAEKSGRFHFAPDSDEFDLLRALAVYTASGFTQAADVLFAKNPSRRHPQTRVRLIRFDSDKGGDAFLENRVFEGPLVRVFDEVFSVLLQHVRTESRFVRGEARREDRPEYPFEALREGLVNAFAHRDYAAFSGGITVSIYPARVEIWNSGRLPDGLEPKDLKRNHPSLPTNPDIAHVVYLRGLMERIGRGTQKIISACDEFGLPAPKWVDRSTGVTLTLFSGKPDLGTVFNINPRQRAFLDALAAGEVLRMVDYRNRFALDVSERQSRRDLTELEAYGFVVRLGGGASTQYQRTNRTWDEGIGHERT